MWENEAVRARSKLAACLETFAEWLKLQAARLRRWRA